MKKLYGKVKYVKFLSYNKIIRSIPEAFWLNAVNLMYPIRRPSSPEPGVLQIFDFTGFNKTLSLLENKIS